MLQTESGARELSREECLALLPTMPVGRIVFTDRALPAVVPVNFVLHRDQVVVRTGATSTLAAAVRNAVVAFEVDDFDAGQMVGWSVTVTGRAEHVVDSDRLRELSGLPLVSWAGSGLDHFIVVPVELVTGRRVGIGPLG